MVQSSLRDEHSFRPNPWAEAHGYRQQVASRLQETARRPLRLLPRQKKEAGLASGLFVIPILLGGDYGRQM
jgi:hypothetical protein